MTDQRAEDEEDHEESSERRLAVDVAVADRRHGDQREVDAVPVGQRVGVRKARERIARVLHLRRVPTQHNKFNLCKTAIDHQPYTNTDESIQAPFGV